MIGLMSLIGLGQKGDERLSALILTLRSDCFVLCTKVPIVALYSLYRT